MYLGLDADLLALAEEARSYFAELVTPDLRAEVDDAPGPLAAAAIRRMGSDGWLGYGWPESLGGRGHTAVEQQVVLDEAQAAGAPWPLLTVGTVAPTLQHFGTPEQRSTLIPRMLAGETRCAIDDGATATTTIGDAATVPAQGVRDGDDWIVRGETTSVRADGDANAVWLACRTALGNDDADGISVLIVDADAIGVVAIDEDAGTAGPARRFRFDDVRVPMDHIVGDVGGGAIVTAHRAAHERRVMSSAGWIIRLWRDVAEWAARTTRADGRRVIDQEWVQITLARVQAGLDCVTLLNRQTAWSTTHASAAAAVDAATATVFGTECFVEAVGLLMEVVGPEAALVDARGTAMRGRLASAFREAIRRTRAGGSNDAQRDVIAASGLRLLLEGTR